MNARSPLKAGPAAAALVVAAVILATWARSSSADQTDWQFYPELDTYVRLDDRTRLFFLFSRTRNLDFESTEGQIGAHVDRFFSRHLRARAGYRYIHSIGDEESPSTEHRVVLELTPRTPAPGATLVSFRNRVELRWVNGADSWRYRPRLRIERDFATGTPRTLTPYAAAEPFFDSRFEHWSRWRYQFGVEAAFGKHVVLEPYFMHQDDTLPSPDHVNAIGFVLNLLY